MIKVVFVGSGPSKLNLSPEIPFVGAKCFDRLVHWISILKPDFYITYNMESTDKIKLLQRDGFKIIALGNEVHRFLEINQIEAYKLPHPSPRNRLTNDYKKIYEKLVECNNWLHGYCNHPDYRIEGPGEHYCTECNVLLL